MLRKAGKYVGPHYQKPHKLVGNSCTVAARKAAKDIANDARLLYSALHLLLPWTLHSLKTSSKAFQQF